MCSISCFLPPNASEVRYATMPLLRCSLTLRDEERPRWKTCVLHPPHVKCEVRSHPIYFVPAIFEWTALRLRTSVYGCIVVLIVDILPQRFGTGAMTTPTMCLVVLFVSRQNDASGGPRRCPSQHGYGKGLDIGACAYFLELPNQPLHIRLTAAKVVPSIPETNFNHTTSSMALNKPYGA